MQLQDDMYYFSKQALIGAAGFVVMFIVSRIDYHIYGAFAVEIYVVSMILMALVRNPSGRDSEWSQKMDPASGKSYAPAGGDYQDRGHPFHIL